MDEFNIWQQETMHSKILKQFNTPKRDGGFNANGFEEYPKMLYKAREHPLSHKFYVALEADELSLDRTRVIVDAQAFNRSCQMEVKDKEMEERAIREGWSKSQLEALHRHEVDILKLAKEAAHRNYDDRNLSEQAKVEAQRVEDSTPGQVAEVPEAPRRRRGRPPKKIATTAA